MISSHPYKTRSKTATNSSTKSSDTVFGKQKKNSVPKNQKSAFVDPKLLKQQELDGTFFTKPKARKAKFKVSVNPNTLKHPKDSDTHSQELRLFSNRLIDVTNMPKSKSYHIKTFIIQKKKKFLPKKKSIFVEKCCESAIS